MVWKAQLLYPGKDAQIGQRTDALKSIAKSISKFHDEVVRDNYVEVVSKAIGIKPKEIKYYQDKKTNDKISTEPGEEDTENSDYFSSIIRTWKLEDDQKKSLRMWWFWKRADQSQKNKYGYYFVNDQSFKVKQVSNFIITPLYHIMVKGKERSMVAVSNGFTEKIIELDIVASSSADAFRKEMRRIPGFYWKGSTDQLLTVFQAMGHNAFPSCFELYALGWHPRGFFAFSNAAFNGKLEEYNQFGMYKHEETHYNVPFLSPIDRDYEQEDNAFDFELYLRYKKSTITFEEWCQLMCSAYDEKGPIAINFAVATLFRDVILQSTKLPILYNYGAVQSGKSDYTDSITNLFFAGRDHQGDYYKAFNLNQGTDFAFFTRMERFRNCPNALNEFDENKIQENWFRAIKGAFDGEGREKGDMERKGKTKAQRINCSIILSGQFLGSKDDNSVVSRSLLNHFPAVIGARPVKQVNAFKELKKQERKGLSSIICDLLQNRKYFETEYRKLFDTAQEYLFAELLKLEVEPQIRVIKNWASILTIHLLLKEKYVLPYPSLEFENYCIKQVKTATEIIGSTNTLAGFWNIFQYLIDTNKIIPGFHWALVKETQVKTVEGDTELWKAPKPILYVRISAIFPYYQEAAQRQKSDTLSRQNLENYTRESQYYLGAIKSRRFSGSDDKGQKHSHVTSCFAIDTSHPTFEALGLSISDTQSGQINAEFNESPQPF